MGLCCVKPNFDTPPNLEDLYLTNPGQVYGPWHLEDGNHQFIVRNHRKGAHVLGRTWQGYQKAYGARDRTFYFVGTMDGIFIRDAQSYRARQVHICYIITFISIFKITIPFKEVGEGNPLLSGALRRVKIH